MADGLMVALLHHTTAALLLSEADEDLLADLEQVAFGWASRFGPFRHRKNDNPNAAAHLLSALAGTQVILPVSEGHVVFGSYQRLVLLELDGPKERTILLRDGMGASGQRPVVGGGA